jgi:hypothetical protein
MWTFVFEAFGMLLLPFVVAISAIPKNGIQVHRLTFVLASLVFAWPLATAARIAFAEEQALQVAGVFVATALGVLAAFVCFQDVKALSAPATQSTSHAAHPANGSDWWGSTWRPLIVWFSVSVPLASFGSIAFHEAGLGQYAPYFGLAAHGVGVVCASIAMHARQLRLNARC